MTYAGHVAWLPDKGERFSPVQHIVQAAERRHRSIARARSPAHVLSSTTDMRHTPQRIIVVCCHVKDGLDIASIEQLGRYGGYGSARGAFEFRSFIRDLSEIGP